MKVLRRQLFVLMMVICGLMAVKPAFAEVSDHSFRVLQKDIKGMGQKVNSLDKELTDIKQLLKELIAGQKIVQKQMTDEHKQLKIWVRRN